MKKKKNKLKIIVVIQARMGSRRLENKALLKITGKTIIEIIFNRLKACREIDDIILSTSLSKENDILSRHAKTIGLKYRRGSEGDLISRHYGAAKKFKADAIVRITGDCPLVDPKLVDKMVLFYRKNHKKFDFITNCFPPTFPDGLDIDITPISILKKLDRKINKRSIYRGFFVTYIMENPNKLKIYNFRNSVNLSSMRLTLDYPEDLVFVRKIFAGLAGKNIIFIMKDILNFLKKNPELLKINEKRVDKIILRNIRSGEYHSIIKN